MFIINRPHSHFLGIKKGFAEILQILNIGGEEGIRTLARETPTNGLAMRTFAYFILMHVMLTIDIIAFLIFSFSYFIVKLGTILYQ